MSVDVNGYDTVFGHPRSTSTGTTSSDFGEQHQVQTGCRNCTQNRKY